MSAIEDTVPERRRAPRLELNGEIPALIGRGEGVLIDLSATGVRLRHAAVVQRGTLVRVSFECGGGRVGATAEVLSSRVVSLGGTATTYDSRLRFVVFDPGAKEALAQELASIETRNVRRWIANLRGWSDEIRERPRPSLITGSYFRCRLVGARWEAKATRDTTQPEDGFVVPATVADREVLRLCEDYRRADEDGRRVIRLMAAAAVEQARTT